jgi:outer membrane protein TolC
MLNKMKELITFLLLMLAFTLSRAANGEHEKSQNILDEYVAVGLKHNPGFQTVKLELKWQQAEMEASRSWIFPEIGVASNYTLAKGGRTISFPVGDIINPVYSALNQINEDNRFPQLENFNEQLIPNEFHDTFIYLRQVFLNSGLIYNYKIQRDMFNAASSNVSSARNNLEFEIRKAYYEHLLTLELKNILIRNRALLEEILRVNQRLVANHKSTNDIVYRTESEISDLDKEMALVQKNIELTAAHFNVLLNRELDAEIILDTDILDREIPVNSSLRDLHEHALAHRSELQTLAFYEDAKNNQLKMYTVGKFMPELQVGMQAGYQGNNYLIGTENDYWLLQLGLKWTVFKGGHIRKQAQKAQIEMAKIESQHQELQNNICLQTSEAYYSLEASIKAYEASIAQQLSAERSFRIIEKKYLENQVLLLEYLDAQIKLVNAEISASVAKYKVLISQSQLKQAIGN